MKKFLCVFILLFLSAAVFAADNMRIFPKENGEVITGFKIASMKEGGKINIAYPARYKEQPSLRYPVVLLLDTKEYKIEDLNKMFYFKKSKNPQALVASVRFDKGEFSQEQFDSFIEEIFAFFEVNYRGESDPVKRIILAKDNLALIALNSMQKEANYFFNLGVILNNTTALPALNKNLKKQSRIFVFSEWENILNLQNLFLAGALKPLKNFFFSIKEDAGFEDFDLRYFLDNTPKIKQIKTNLPKEIAQDTHFYLKVKTNYGFLNFFPTQVKFAPPVLMYEAQAGLIKIMLQEPLKVKISGVFEGTEWSGKVKIAK